MPKITLEVSDKVYAWLVKESELTGYTVEAIVVRWVESGQLNAKETAMGKDEVFEIFEFKDEVFERRSACWSTRPGASG